MIATNGSRRSGANACRTRLPSFAIRSCTPTAGHTSRRGPVRLQQAGGVHHRRLARVSVGLSRRRFPTPRRALHDAASLCESFAGETENLAADGDQITTLGQINGRLNLAGQEITAGRQLVRTPYINPYDIRMIPLAFEGVVLAPEHRRSGLDYMASYLTRYKPWDQGGFISFSEGLGIAESDEGVLITGASYSANGWNIGASNYWIKDSLNTAYGEIDYLLPFGNDDDGPSVRAGVNILDQRTVGADLIAGAPYETYQASARIVTSYRGLVLTGAMSKTGDAADIQKPFGYSTSYTALVVTNFDQADVQAYLVRLSYDLERLGLEGVRLEAAWGKGSGTPDLATNGGFADQEELDLRFVYEPHRGKLQGLRVEVEYIDWQVFDNPTLPSDDLDQFRAIVNYAVPLL
ncbi:OprD family outer membrane porin [Methyloceanibacter marginalis]|uniref:OprD family outer membrane porin n=1 Tax=Methyloceanibacter marginalis TaxID=1774971 RepID=UPI001FCCD367|nr:OprD family outer membrane porin [Methyloceanibacter marginalis]